MLNKVVKRICSCAILICILVLSISRVSFILENKESANRYAAYFAEEKDIDVLFLGSSHVGCGFLPMELWNDYGVSSYNLAGAGDTLPVAYWTLVNALDYQKPELVVLDVYDFTPGSIVNYKMGRVHTQFDAFPLSIHKIQMMLDLFHDEDLTELGTDINIYKKRCSLLFGLEEYHTRWSELAESDFEGRDQVVTNSRIWKGSNILINIEERSGRIAEQSEIFAIGLNGQEYDDQSKEYLEKTIELCREEGIELLLINTGYDCIEESQVFHDSVEEIAAENGIKYIDFTKEGIINFDTDLDSTGHNSHVNVSGAQKFTKYIGNEIDTNYNLIDHREDEAYQDWEQDYIDYTESKIEILSAQESVYSYLLLLYDDDYKVEIQIRDSAVYNDTKTMNLLANLGIEMNDIDSNFISLDVATGECNFETRDYDVDDSSHLVVNVYSKTLGSWLETRTF